MRPSPGLTRAKQRWMVDTCTITRAGTSTFNDVTGGYSTVGGTTIYTGSCLVQPYTSTQATEQEIGSLEESLARYEVHLPPDATSVNVGDLVTVTASADTDLQDRPLTVMYARLSTWLTDQVLIVEDRTTA